MRRERRTHLVPATMKTKVVRVAMPSTKRIWFLKPPNSPRLESSLDKIFKGLVSGYVSKKVPLLNLVVHTCPICPC